MMDWRTKSLVTSISIYWRQSVLRRAVMWVKKCILVIFIMYVFFVGVNPRSIIPLVWCQSSYPRTHIRILFKWQLIMPVMISLPPICFTKSVVLLQELKYIVMERLLGKSSMSNQRDSLIPRYECGFGFMQRIWGSQRWVECSIIDSLYTNLLKCL